MTEPISMKLGMYIMPTEPISMAYYINPSHQSVCLYVYPSYRCKTTARLSVYLFLLLGNGLVNTFPCQRIQATIEELLDVSFCMRSVSYQRRVCGSVYPLTIARQQFGKDLPEATNNCWRRRFLCGQCIFKGPIISPQSSFFDIRLAQTCEGCLYATRTCCSAEEFTRLFRKEYYFIVLR
jgi:hypothetical protein